METDRLKIIPLTQQQLKLLLTDTNKLANELKVKYSGDIIKGHLKEVIQQQYNLIEKNKENYMWYTFWQIILKSENTIIGSFDFKGLPDNNGYVEIGYGINKLYENKGYMTEAINKLCEWALEQSNIKGIIAETSKDNIASQKVLTKCKMVKCKETNKSIWWKKDKISIRLATVEDATIISNIHALTWKSSYIGMIPQKYLDDLKIDHWVDGFNKFLKDDSMKVQILYVKYLPVGVITYGKSREDTLTDCVEIVSFYILKEHQNRGYGKKLLNVALDDSKALGFKSCYLWVINNNESSKRFYEKNGFSLTSDNCSCKIYDRDIINLRYTKDLI